MSNKAAATAKSEAAKVGKVNVGKVDVGVLNAALDGIGKEAFDAAFAKGEQKYAYPAPGSTLGDKIVALTAYYTAAPDYNETCLSCDNCGGISPEELDVCPYCGIASGAEPGEAVAAEVVEPPVAKQPKAAKADKEKPAVVPALALVEQKPAEPFPAEAASGTREKAQTVAPSSLSMLIPKIGAKDMNEDTLDSATKQVLYIKANAAMGHWALGKALEVIFATEIWKTRTKPGKKGERVEGAKHLYSTFDQWCRNEVKMAGSTCYSLIDMAKKFSEKQARELGTSKLQLTMRAPEEEQARILKSAEEGASTRQIREAVHEAKAKTGMQKRETGRKATPAGKAGQTTKKESARYANGKVTTTLVEGSTLIPMFAKPDRKGDETKPAKRFADNPIAEEHFHGGVTRTYSILEHPTTGVWRLKIETKRATD